MVKHAVEHGADIHADNKALQNAAWSGHLDVVKYLVEQEANIHANDEYALRWAAYNGHFDVVKYLIEHGADIHAENEDALRSAALEGHLDIVKYLIGQYDTPIPNDLIQKIKDTFDDSELDKLLSVHEVMAA